MEENLSLPEQPVVARNVKGYQMAATVMFVICVVWGILSVWGLHVKLLVDYWQVCNHVVCPFLWLVGYAFLLPAVSNRATKTALWILLFASVYELAYDVAFYMTWDWDRLGSANG